MRAHWLLLFCLGLTGCTGGSGKSSSATTSEKPKAEGDLVFSTLSKKRAEALKIETQPVVLKEVKEQLAVTGWVMAKPGHEVTLTAPTAGYVHFHKDLSIPVLSLA